MKLAATLFGDERAKRRLTDLVDRADDLRPGWDKVLGRLRLEEVKIFSSRGKGATGMFQRWPRNSPRTIARKGSDQPLIDTGRLNDALTRRRAPGSIARRSKTQALFGVNDRAVFYSRFVGKRRPFIVSEKNADRIATRALIDHLEGRDR